MNVMLMALFLSLEVAPSDAGQIWHDDYGAALAETKQLKKPLLVVLENPDDEPSRIHQVSLQQQDERDELLKNYVLCKLDVRTEHGRKMAEGFKAQRVPHTVVIDKTGGWQLFKKTGKLTDSEWTATLAKHKRGVRVRPIVYARPTYSYGSAGCST
jgi:hypothetical protein